MHVEAVAKAITCFLTPFRDIQAGCAKGRALGSFWHEEDSVRSHTDVCALDEILYLVEISFMRNNKFQLERTS